ncbi:MBL fold metallo-hydrolase [Paenibacillus segetis]|uniref:MBL fold hydrolase n=1 Tax=Paenibacillus segetis TaxID=1325360 RepID=A0ABQ1YEA8_9BACL|nr:MBL fold metallo-hydrolase [Paenibacillus segetis]GGH21586.1 MBL fold hydrolase [Paenibacillus segetis]
MNYCLLDIEFEHNGQQQIITPTLLQDEYDKILIDCGYPNFTGLIEQAVNKYDVTLDSITKLIVTHHDIDHVGSLAAIKWAYPHIQIIAYEMEVPYIEGNKKVIRLEQAESTFNELPEEAKSYVQQFMDTLKAVETVRVDQAVKNGEILPWCGGIEIIHTPGHVPGHISLYLPSSKTLIAGDVVVIEQGKLGIANPQFADDLDEAIRSVRRLLDYDIEQIICYHGGLFQGDVRQALQQLVQEYTT